MRRIHSPALWIIAAVVLLAVLQGYYAYSNQRRQRDLMTDFLTRQGLVTLQALATGVRAGSAEPAGGEVRLRRLLDEMGRHPGVVYLDLRDEGGQVLSGAGAGGGPPAGAVLAAMGGRPQAAWMEADGRVFHVAQALARPTPAGAGAGAPGPIAVVGLDAQRFVQAQREDARRALGTGVVILFLGGAALCFLFVTQRANAARQALSVTQTYAQNLVDSISSGVFSVDRNGKVVSMNHVACQILQITPEQAIGRSYRDLVAHGDCPLEPTIRTGERILEKEMSCTSLGGGRVEVSVSASQLCNEVGEVLGAVVVLRDLREIRALEDQLRRSERLASMGRMVAGVAHELRNPLSSIKGFARYFQRKYAQSPQDGEYAQLLVREADRLNRVITDLLSFAQPPKPHRAAVSVPEVVEHALRLCQAEIQDHGITVERRFAAGLQPLQADRDLLVQALVNHFRNGVEAMPGGGRLTVAAQPADGLTRISVTDTGHGIAPHDRPHIFDPFFTTRPGGTGLGLAIIHGIVAGHGGRIEVESQPGQGAAFHLMLPAGE
ncbi:MAG: ATP-binding protein [Candidatus Latescibacterota bacterium]